MRVRLLLALLLAAACSGGGSAPTGTPLASATASAPASAAVTPSGDASPEAALCLLTAEDWQQFNYVTGASPDVTSDGPGSAICQYASGLFLEVYTHERSADATETFETILENASFDEPQNLSLPGAEEVVFDPDIGGDNAGIAVRAGNLVYTISGLARDSSQAELMALAGLVLQRGADLI